MFFMSLAAKPQDLGTVGGYLWEVRPDALKFGADLLLYHGRPDEAWAMALFFGAGVAHSVGGGFVHQPVLASSEIARKGGSIAWTSC